ncbi:ABC transporter substrate-binding protein [Fonticella tunisiensis]|uniref:Iron complex transport system substrate-binding protein n=1 Tax=Fonticella tunisiensis TaxID=1096341 RepID=A0A4R7KXE2_9CLOT|nr:ABC transporter substrate-binding protein [Fonticella tunisiensis]TDT63616.1 iron complex transport system substrate-binding protein [Fonticella tunisiensis]
MKKFLALVILLLFSTIIFIGCAKESKETNAKDSKKVVSTIKGDVEIPSNPKRIVDISGSSEELIILGHTPVATANTDPYKPTEFASYIKDKLGNSKIVGFYMSDTMNIEAILQADPDLIIMSQRQEKIYDQLKEIAPVVMIKDYANDWRTKMLDIAKLFNQESYAQKWLDEYDKKAQTIAKEIVEKNGKQTYLTVLASAGQFYIFSDAGIGAILYNDMKLDKPAKMPAQEGISLPVVTLEGLSQIDADHLIVIATEEDKKNLENSSVWKNIRAVKEGNVTMLESTPYFGQGYSPIGRELLLDLIKEKIIKK